MGNTILHKKSCSVIDGVGRIPSPDIIMHGEIAINYANGYETIFIKNDNDEIVGIKSEKYYKDIVNGKQDELVSGENIKTINGVSLLESGNIEISAEHGVLSYDNVPTEGSTNLVNSGNIYKSLTELEGRVNSYTDLKTSKYILYENSSINYNDITLNDNISNYEFIEIYAETSSGVSIYEKVYMGDGKKVSMKHNQLDNGLYVSSFKTYILNGNTINIESGTGGYVTTTNNNKHNITETDTHIGIRYVIGYNKIR